MHVGFKWPKNRGYVKAADGAFVAIGRASQDVTGMNWTCESLSGSANPIKGRLISIFPANGGSGGPLRWVLGLRVKTPGEYRLTISGQTPLGPTPEQSVDFQVAFPFLGALIDWPGPNEPITDYKDDFTAYGPLSPDQLGPATLKDEDCVSVMLLSSSSDPVELKMWTASFASLDTGVYTLHVEDTQGHGDTSDGLSVA